MNIEKEIDFKALFETVPGLYLILLPDLTIVAVSDAYAMATMTKREAIAGRNLFDVFPGNPADLAANGVSNLRASLDFVLKNRTTHTMTVQKYDIRRPDGIFEERYWSPVNKPLFNDSGEVSHIIHSVVDVTEIILLQKEKTAKDKIADDLAVEIYKHSQEIHKLNAELEHKVAERTSELESVNQTISDYKFALDESSIVAVTDQRGIIQHVNDNFCIISKYSREELIGQDHRIINSGHHSKEFIRDLWQTIANGSIWKGKLKNKARDGTIYWVDTTIVPFLNHKGKPFKYLAIRSDITLQMQFLEELEAKVQERTLALTESLVREKDLNEMKSRFVSFASHEFRTPLTNILASASLIEMYAGNDQAEKRAKHINRITSAVKSLTEILNDFLSLERLEKGIIEVEKCLFNLPAFVKEILESTEGMMNRKCQKVIYGHQGEEMIELPEKILRNILLNLVSNASKYSAEEKEIQITSCIYDGKVTIRVKDQGIGIPIADREKLFGEFFRAGNVGNAQGTGLGLAIVKKYVSILNGDISFVSEPGEGTTFVVEFPLF